MPIKAFSGSISSLPLPEIKLTDVQDGDILAYDASRKIFVNTLSADKLTGRVFVTGVKSSGGESLVNGVEDRDIALKGIKAGNMITVEESIDGNSLVIGVSSNIRNTMQDPTTGFTGELKTSDIVVVPDNVGKEFKFYKTNNGQELELNGNFTIVFRNGRRLRPDEYTFTSANTAVFYDILEGDELHVDTITGETDNYLIHSKTVRVALPQTAYEFVDQQGDLIAIDPHFLEVFVNRIKVHQGEYVVQENKVVFAAGSIVDEDELTIITLGDI